LPTLRAAAPRPLPAEPEGLGGGLDLSEHERIARVGRVPEHGDPRQPWDSVFEQLKSLRGQFQRLDGQAGQIASRPGEAHGDAEGHRVHHRGHDDGDHTRCPLEGEDRFAALGDQHIRPSAQKLRSEPGQKIRPPFRPPDLQEQILTLDVA
jgi:hypothetical protein